MKREDTTTVTKWLRLTKKAGQDAQKDDPEVVKLSIFYYIAQKKRIKHLHSCSEYCIFLCSGRLKKSAEKALSKTLT